MVYDGLVPNTVLLEVTFLSLPASDEDYNKLLSNINNSLFNDKHQLMSGSKSNVSLNYYRFKSLIYDHLSKFDTGYSEYVCPSDVNYSLYAVFSGDFDIGFNVCVSKYGDGIIDDRDKSHRTYYNRFDTNILSGLITDQSIGHVDSKGKLVSVDVNLSSDDFVLDLLSFSDTVNSEASKHSVLSHNGISRGSEFEDIKRDTSYDMSL